MKTKNHLVRAELTVTVWSHQINIVVERQSDEVVVVKTFLRVFTPFQSVWHESTQQQGPLWIQMTELTVTLCQFPCGRFQQRRRELIQDQSPASRLYAHTLEKTLQRHIFIIGIINRRLFDDVVSIKKKKHTPVKVCVCHLFNPPCILVLVRFVFPVSDLKLQIFRLYSDEMQHREVDVLFLFFCGWTVRKSRNRFIPCCNFSLQLSVLLFYYELMVLAICVLTFSKYVVVLTALF